MRQGSSDRTKEPGSIGEPLFLDTIAALDEMGRTGLKVSGGRYGLGSTDTPPASIFAVYEHLKEETPARQFTIGINDDVTHLSLPELSLIHIWYAYADASLELFFYVGIGYIMCSEHRTSNSGCIREKAEQYMLCLLYTSAISGQAKCRTAGTIRFCR